MAELFQTTNVSETSAIDPLSSSLTVFQQVIDHLPGAVSWQDRNLTFQGCNRAFAQAVGLNDPSEIVGKSQQDIRWANGSSDFLQTGNNALLEQHQPTFHTTVSLPSQDGYPIWLDIHKTLLYDGMGKVAGVISTITDITAQQQTEQTLKRTAEQAVLDCQQAKKALDETETRFQTLLANVPGMLFQFVRHPRGILAFPFVSPGCLSVFELSPVQIEADANLLFDLVQPGDRRTLERSIAISAKTLQPWHWEGWFTLPSGKPIFVKGSARPEQQADGAILWSGFLVEATRRKRAEDSLQRAYEDLEQRVEQRTVELARMNEALQLEIREHQQADIALRASEARLRALVENLPFDFWANDADGYYIMQNRIDMENWGHLLGKRLEDLDLPPDVVQQWQEQNARLFAGEVLRTEDSYEIDGELRTFSKIMAPVWEGNEIRGTLGANIEITEQKRAEAALREQAQELEQAFKELKRTQTQMIQSEKMSSLGQLVAGVAHEINNPVNFIYGNLNHASDYIQDLLNLIELYQQHYPSPCPEVEADADAIDLPFLMTDLPKLLASMRTGTERIRQIVLSLRNFSRMDEAEMKTVDIHEGMDSTLMILQNRLKARGSQPAIEVVKDYGNLPLVECYPGQLNQVFMNILSNAIDALEEAWDRDDVLVTAGTTTTDSAAMPQHFPTIRISTELGANDRIHIIIADNGLGIPEIKLQQLFDPFFTTKPVGKGTGLGLSISYQIITEKHKGELWCVSAPGQGAVFHIKIPIQQQE